MFIIRKADFALLYRAEIQKGSYLDQTRAKAFRKSNPECPHLKKAKTYFEAVLANKQLFEII